MDLELLAVLYAVYDPQAPGLPEHLLHVWDEATDDGLLTPNGRHLTDAGEKALRDGLQAVADTVAGIKATVRLAGGLTVEVTLTGDWEHPRTGPSAWWAVHRALFPIVRHTPRIELH